MLEYVVSLFTIALCFGAAAMALNVVMGELGAFHLAGGLLFGTGAYVYALTSGYSPWMALFTSTTVAGAVSVVVLLPFIHLTQRPAFLFVTLAIQLIAFHVFNNAVSLTRGAAGISGIRPPLPGLISESTLVVVVVLSMIGLLHLWSQSHSALTVRLIRQDEIAAGELGIYPITGKLKALALAGCLLGLSGALYAGVVGFVSPRDVGLDVTVSITVIVLVCPLGRPWLTCVVGVIIYSIPELARFFSSSTAFIPALRTVLFGVLLIVISRFRGGQ